MSFDVTGDAYGRFMGRYSEPLADRFCDYVGVTAGQRALDVGCGPGALTERLAGLLGPSEVSAIDPSEPFVEATRKRCPGVDVRVGTAEDLPYPDQAYDLALAQLVLPFMRDPAAGLTEMVRVTRSGGSVGASVWDHAGGNGPISPFWDAVLEFDPQAESEAVLTGFTDHRLVDLAREAGLTGIEQSRLTVEVVHQSFEEWWLPYTAGVGPAGDYVAGLTEADTERLRDHCRQRLPAAPFTITASALVVRGSVG